MITDTCICRTLPDTVSIISKDTTSGLSISTYSSKRASSKILGRTGFLTRSIVPILITTHANTNGVGTLGAIYSSTWICLNTLSSMLPAAGNVVGV